MKLVLLMVAIFGTAACTTMRSEPPPAGSNGPSSVAVGDRVRVTKRNGEALTFDVTGVTANSLEGTNRSGDVLAVALDDLASLEVRRLAPGRIGALVGALLFAVLGVNWLEDNVAFFPGP
jgi:hypothetical protein